MTRMTKGAAIAALMASALTLGACNSGPAKADANDTPDLAAKTAASIDNSEPLPAPSETAPMPSASETTPAQ
jgi:PBP1b-binding outer membrane lipoprotein LpoB